MFGLDSGRVQEQIPGAVDTGLTLHTAAGVLLLSWYSVPISDIQG